MGSSDTRAIYQQPRQVINTLKKKTKKTSVAPWVLSDVSRKCATGSKEGPGVQIVDNGSDITQSRMLERTEEISRLLPIH